MQKISPLLILIVVLLSALITVSFRSVDAETPQTTFEPVYKKEIKNVILLIGDGMGVSQVYTAYTVKQDNLNMARCKQIGFMTTWSADRFIPDSGAAATAMATGTKTNNEMIGVDPDGQPLKNIIDYCSENDLATGLVATAYITHATPAGYYAHEISRHDYENIALDFLRSTVDVVIGGGRDHFDKREDGKNLTDSLSVTGYKVVTDVAGLDTVHEGRLAGLLYSGHPPKKMDGRGDMLGKSTMKAIEILDKDTNGFFLMVESSQIDWGGHNNDIEYIKTETVDFDDVIGQVLDFAEKDGETLVIITGDHETGGLAISGGDIKSGRVYGKFPTTGHTGVMVPVFSYGPGSENYSGIFDNTDLFYKILHNFGISE